ncbi:hypothetical protein D9Q98_008120 [Chlorella vulgaris]|uniref:NAD(P)-binding domain-containing protein n=1 Tax=Chlorella vulgaris TaxID=3077 RepID=A0A9D4YST0_CHLVU|nr:hypothetical protein D9Q98_008120 [Chlorella vulgaris]
MAATLVQSAGLSALNSVRASASQRTSAIKAVPALRFSKQRRHARIIVSAAAASSSDVPQLEAPPIAPLNRQLPEADERYDEVKVLVAGATGGVGKAVVRQLAAQGIAVRALSRSGLKAAGMLPPASQGVEIVEGDVYRYSDVAKAMKGCTAVIIATGPTDRLNPFGSYQTDFEGNKNLVAAAKQEGVKKVVLVTSIGTDDPLFPLNLLWGVLLWKKQGELALQRSGIDYTIVRPGGLLNEPRAGRTVGNVVIGGADAYGLPPRRRPGSILRTQVAECCVAALVEPAASNKVVEIVTEVGAPPLGFTELFSSV